MLRPAFGRRAMSGDAAEAAIEAGENLEASDLPHLQNDGLTMKRRLQKAVSQRGRPTAADFAEGGRLERHALGFRREKKTVLTSELFFPMCSSACFFYFSNHF